MNEFYRQILANTTEGVRTQLRQCEPCRDYLRAAAAVAWGLIAEPGHTLPLSFPK